MATSSPEDGAHTAAAARAPRVRAAALYLMLALPGLHSAVGIAAAPPLIKGSIASPDPHRPPINWQAEHMELDYQTHHIVWQKFAITQGDMSATADSAEASGMDVRNSHWVLTGDVHVRSENQGELQSDRATLEFSNSLLVHAVVTGQPAQFQQTQSASGLLAHGHASSIDYDVQAGIVRLSDNAWLSNGPSNEMSAPELTYNVRTKQIEGTGTPAGGRFHAVVLPRPGKPAKPGAAAASGKHARPTAAPNAPGSGSPGAGAAGSQPPGPRP